MRPQTPWALHPEPRSLVDYVTAPFKQEVSLLKHMRHARQVSALFKSMYRVRQTLVRANACQCGMDSAHYSMYTMGAMVTMDSSATLAHAETSEAFLCCASTLHRYGLPLDYAVLESFILPETCS